MASSNSAPIPTKDVLDACRRLLQGSDVGAAISEALAAIGRATGVDRVYIFAIEHHETEYASQTFEWTSDRVAPEIDNPELQNIPLREAGYTRWLEEMGRYRPIVGPIASFPPSEQPMLAMQGIQSLLVLPIYSEGTLVGFVGFDDCTQGRQWSRSDVDVLIALTMALGIALSDEGVREAERAVALYLRLLGRLFDVHAIMFSGTSPIVLGKRAAVRLRIVARSYQHFARLDDGDLVEMGSYIKLMRPLLDEFVSARDPGRRATLSSSVGVRSLTIKRALDLAIITGEVLAAIIDHPGIDLSGAHVLVSLQPRDENVELAITARSSSAEPIGRGDRLDGMAVSLLRDIRQHFDGSVSQDLIDGLLLRVSFRG
jgi:two-component sensor histidine kinase